MRVLLTALLVFLPCSLPAQASAVPGTGCEMGLPAPRINGSVQLGGAFDVQCNIPTASVRTLLLLGACTANPWPLPASIACESGCTIGIDPNVLVVLDPRRQLIALQIPNVPQLVGVSFCTQCFEDIMFCVTVSGATRVTIQP